MKQSGFNGMVTSFLAAVVQSDFRAMRWSSLDRLISAQRSQGSQALKVGEKSMIDLLVFITVSGGFWLIFRVHSVHSVQVRLSIPDPRVKKPDVFSSRKLGK